MLMVMGYLTFPNMGIKNDPGRRLLPIFILFAHHRICGRGQCAKE
jgi:hypothetical protein